MSGVDASSPPTGPESPATPTSEMWAARLVTRDGEKIMEPGTDPNLIDSLMASDGSSSQAWIFSAEAFPAKTSLSPDAEQDSQAAEAASSSSSCESQMSLLDPADGALSKTCRASSVPMGDGTWLPSSGRWPTSGFGIWPTEFWIAGSSESPSGGGVSSSLRDVLEDAVPERYFLSPRAAAGILRRAEKRGRELPPHLLSALRTVADTASTPSKPQEGSSS